MTASILVELEKVNTNKHCKFYHQGCPANGTGCKPSDENTCREAIRRNKLEQTPCPAMISRGYSKQNSKCNRPWFRAWLPPGINCYVDGNCLIIYYPEFINLGQESKTSLGDIKISPHEANTWKLKVLKTVSQVVSSL